MFDTLLVEKYRPKTLNDLVLKEDVKKFFQTITPQTNIPHLLFSGTPGIGKTTLAKIIVNDLLKCEYIYINASDENGIDDIRNKVKNFIMMKSMLNTTKVVILDESDGLSQDAQNCLRNMMEEYSTTSRFILTCNNEAKISEAIKSRCQTFDLNFDLKSMIRRLVEIVKVEKLKIDKDSLLISAKENYPDFRKAINSIQRKVLGVETSDTNNTLITSLYRLVQKKTSPDKIRKLLLENRDQFNTYVSLMIDLSRHVMETQKDDSIKRKHILDLNSFIEKDFKFIDKELNFYALLVTLTA